MRVSPNDILSEKIYQEGRKDRADGKPCKSANGAYLNGWYGDTPHYYLTESEAKEYLNDTLEAR